MSLSIEITEVSERDILKLSVRMRDADRAEVRAASGASIETVVRESVEHSEEARAVYVNGEFCCIYGVVRLEVFDMRYGIPWMLATDTMLRWPTHIMRIGREVVGRWNERYDGLVNYVHAENVTSVRWLERLGFELGEAEPYGVSGEDFRRFVMMREAFPVQRETSPVEELANV